MLVSGRVMFWGCDVIGVVVLVKVLVGRKNLYEFITLEKRHLHELCEERSREKLGDRANLGRSLLKNLSYP